MSFAVFPQKEKISVQKTPGAKYGMACSTLTGCVHFYGEEINTEIIMLKELRQKRQECLLNMSAHENQRISLSSRQQRRLLAPEGWNECYLLMEEAVTTQGFFLDFVFVLSHCLQGRKRSIHSKISPLRDSFPGNIIFGFINPWLPAAILESIMVI